LSLITWASVASQTLCRRGATMPTNPRAQRTDFSLDVPGRYTCNGLDEANTSVALGGRPFDLIVVGGGSFGGALAQELFANDQAQVHRILVLEGGPLALPEHVQNMPLQWLGVPPGATSIAELRSQGLDGQPRAEPECTVPVMEMVPVRL
jgi:pimeloyl-ACP methyl ester carboxylesterase